MPYQVKYRPNDASIRIRKRTYLLLKRELYNRGWLQSKNFTWDQFIKKIILELREQNENSKI